jgi:predicted PurR-regulated permease PerM
MNVQAGFEFLGLCTTVIAIALVIAFTGYWWFEKVTKNHPWAQATTFVILLAVTIFLIGAMTGVTHR